MRQNINNPKLKMCWLINLQVIINVTVKNNFPPTWISVYHVSIVRLQQWVKRHGQALVPFESAGWVVSISIKSIIQKKWGANIDNRGKYYWTDFWLENQQETRINLLSFFKFLLCIVHTVLTIRSILCWRRTVQWGIKESLGIKPILRQKWH